jgi:hypothetical protein
MSGDGVPGLMYRESLRDIEACLGSVSDKLDRDSAKGCRRLWLMQPNYARGAAF